MVAIETPPAQIGWKADDFNLPATDDKHYSLNALKGDKGLLIMFICNHCPYVLKQLDRMIALNNKLSAIGVNTVAINANDATQYPDDSFDNMKKLVAEHQLPFPYLYDESQQTAKRYGAVCTPDFYGLNSDLTLQYRGRLDESWSMLLDTPNPDLFLAMQDIANTGKTDRPQHPSIGCSIKWKTA